MPAKGKRKSNSGKADKRCPQLKTRLPVTGHPEPPSPTLPDHPPSPPPTAEKPDLRSELTRHEESLPPAHTDQAAPASQILRQKWEALNRLKDLDSSPKDNGKGKLAAPPPPPPVSAPSPTQEYEDLSEYEKEPETDGPWTNAVVVHAVKTRYQLNNITRWLVKDNADLPVAGARWLLTPQHRTGKQHSSVVIHLSRPTQHPNQGIRLDGRRLRTTNYDESR